MTLYDLGLIMLVCQVKDHQPSMAATQPMAPPRFPNNIQNVPHLIRMIEKSCSISKPSEANHAIYIVLYQNIICYIYNLFGIDWNFLKAPDPPSASVARHRWFCSTISWMPLWLDSLSQPLPGLWVGSIWFLAIEPWSSKPLLIDDCPGNIYYYRNYFIIGIYCFYGGIPIIPNTWL